MAEADTGLDALEILLSGGNTSDPASNTDPAESLGGLVTDTLVRGMRIFYDVPVQGLIIEDATPENGEGQATLTINGNNVTYTPPNGGAGAAVAIAAGERKLVQGPNPRKAVRIQRVSGLEFVGVATFTLQDALQGVLSMGNVTSADRVAGEVYYRAIFLHASSAVTSVKCWVTTDGQAAWALAKEEPDSVDTIQTIADEETAPSGLSWVNAASEATALDVGNLGSDELMGVWIRRTFPAAGTVAQKEQVNFHLKFDA